ncbi:unnamed protein product [Alternaria alternata]
MADSPASTNSALSGESPAQTKARLRRERLAAKSGASRLQQITALQGGPPKDLKEIEKDVPVKPASTPSQFTPTASGTATPDPDEVDISQHHYAPASQPRLPSPFAFEGNQSGPFGPGPGSDASQDPMMAMLQQMMGAGADGMPGMSGAPGQAGAPPGGLPPNLANMFSAMQGGSGASEPSPEQSSAWIWRLVHSVFSFGLAVYIVLQTPLLDPNYHGIMYLTMTGLPNPLRRRTSRTSSTSLQLSRLSYSPRAISLKRVNCRGSGILSTVAGILPAPYSGYVRTVGRYSVIYSTVVSDVMVVVFVLGATSWWRGAEVA